MDVLQKRRPVLICDQCRGNTTRLVVFAWPVDRPMCVCSRCLAEALELITPRRRRSEND